MDPNAREKKCGGLKGDIVSKEALQGCPNHSAVRTDDAAAIRKYKAWGWSVGKKSQKKVQRELKWKQSLAPMS